MDLTKEALQHIAENQTAETVQGFLNLAEIDDEQAPLIALPHGVSIENIEQFQKHAFAFKASINTNSYDDFIDYCKKFDSDTAVCFINADKMAAVTTFDTGSVNLPGHRLHTSTLVLKKSAAYSALLDINGKALDQKKAAEFLEDWQFNIEARDNSDKAISAGVAAATLRDLTIEKAKIINSKVGDFSNELSELERVEAKNKDTIVANFTFDCNPYHGINPHRLFLRVSLRTSGSEPGIVFRIIQLEESEERITEEFKTNVRDSLDDCEMDVFIGSMA